MSIAVYVDSYSMYKWEEYVDIGEIHLAIRGSSDLETYEDEVRDIPSITRAAFLKMSYLEIHRSENITSGDTDFYSWGIAIAPDQDFFGTFPSLIVLESGRLPESNQEVAVPSRFHLFVGLDIGELVNVSVGHFEDLELEIVGIYSQEKIGSVSPYGYSSDIESVALLSELPASPYYSYDAILASVDRGPISPFNPQYSLAYVNTINEQVRRLDPAYNPPRFGSSLYPESFVGGGISGYILWVQLTRLGQIVRSMSVFLLAALVIFLAIRFNTNERRFERNMLISRGASLSELDSAVNREVLILSIASCMAGIPLGTLFSRIAMSASGYFRFNLSKVLTEPFLVSFESVLISAVVGIALPMITLVGYRAMYSTKRSVEEHSGKLAKLVKTFNFIRWDALVVFISFLLLLVLYSGGTSSGSLLAILQPVPLVLFLGVSSLSIKALRAGFGLLSRLFSRVVGEIPASIGVRRIGKSASSAGAAMMVLVLAICLSWNCAIVDLSLPATKTNQARLDIGADISFALDWEQADLWVEFSNNISSNAEVDAIDLTSELHLSLTPEDSGTTTFLAVNPENYSRIGFDHLGNRLNESGIMGLMLQLESTPDGAIITSDLARVYDLKPGDQVRASNLGVFNPQTYAFRIIGIVTALPKMPEVDYPWWAVPYDYYYYRPNLAGQRRIMINREYLSTLLNVTKDAQNYLCVGTQSGVNGTVIAQEALQKGGQSVLFNEIWDAVDKQVMELVGDTAYLMERALDTMLTVLTVGTILGAFALYAAEGVRTRKREIALLRSMGADKSMITSAQAAEMLVLILFGLALLAGYGPLFLTTSVLSSVSTTLASSQVYPVPVFLVVPWTTILLVLAFFIAIVLTFILIVAAFSSRIHLASALNATWAEAGPYGGDV